MAIFFIVGKNTCTEYVHALHVAQILENHLPNFRYRTLQKEEGEWEAYLECLNNERGWHQRKSPLIWKEITRMGGTPHLIGSLSEFWEYCYDYYGFQSLLSKTEKEMIFADNLFIKTKQIAKIRFKRISIIGAFNPITDFIILELQNYVNVGDNGEIIITLYDENVEDPDEQENFLQMIEDIKQVLRVRTQSLRVVTTLTEALQDCDILFVVKNFSRHHEEAKYDWLHRCMSEMLFLSEEINLYAKRSLRVILCHEGPVCFNASALIEYCTTIRLANIVAVTADEGLSALDFIAQKHGLQVSQMGSPPVWGFSGYNSYIDLNALIIKNPVYRPFTRASKLNDNSALPKGRIKYELRLLTYLIADNEEMYQSKIIERKEKQVQLHRSPMLPRVRALASLLKIWLSGEKSDKIISLGVCSNGSFGFPLGIVMSQPVILNEKNIWEPFSNFPVMKNTRSKIEEMLGEIEHVLEKFDFGRHKKDN